MIKKISKSIREYKKESIFSILFISLEVLMEVLIPVLMALLIDKGITAKNFDVIIKCSILLLVVSLISLLSGYFASVFSSKASCGFAKNLRKDMYYKVQDYSFSNIDKFSTSSIITRLTTDVSNVQMSYMMIIRTALRSPLMLIFSLVMAFLVNKKIAIIFLIIIPLLGFTLFIIGKKAFPMFERVFKTYDELNNDIQENIRGVRVVKSYVKEAYEIKKFSKISKLIYNRFCKAEKIVSINFPVMQFSMYLTTTLICWFGSKLIIFNSMSLGELTSLISYTNSILASLMMLSMIYVMCTMSLSSCERIVEILDEESDICNSVEPLKQMSSGSIEFKNVSFAYSNNKMVLENVNLKINSGEVIGIIGGTGSSKSTLVNLISRLYDVSSGEVLVGGHNVKEYDLEFLRHKIAYVLQKNVLFSGTIVDNLRWGDKNASLADIKRVCKVAQAEEFINQLPNKYNYYIEQGGTNVSGGQRQRLCIARALLKDPKVLILDDSTSAVDTATDSKIREGLKKCFPFVTKIIIAQRINSIENADKIIVLDNGIINAFDTPSNLLKNNKIYQEVYYSQKRGDK